MAHFIVMLYIVEGDPSNAEFTHLNFFVPLFEYENSIRFLLVCHTLLLMNDVFYPMVRTIHSTIVLLAKSNKRRRISCIPIVRAYSVKYYSFITFHVSPSFFTSNILRILSLVPRNTMGCSKIFK